MLDLSKLLKPPRAGIFLSDGAVRAIRRIVRKDKGACIVRIMDVRRAMRNKKKFRADDHLTFRLEYLGGKDWRRSDCGFTNDKVSVVVHKKYLRFLIGGRVLHYESGVDGKGFALRPVEWFKKRLELLGDSEDFVSGAKS